MPKQSQFISAFSIVRIGEQMKLTAIKNMVTSKLGRQVLTVQKHSPTILFTAGVVGIVATVVLASRATLRLTEVIEEAEEDLYNIKTMDSKRYSDDDRRKDTIIVYSRTAMKIAKLYGLPTIIGVASIAALTGSHVILNRRNVALTAAYAALDRGFREYRQRVKDQLGEEKEAEFRYCLADSEIVEETKNGPVVKTVKRAGPDSASIYAKYFDEGSPSWNPQAGYNMMFLRAQQAYANNMLQARGHLFLNEVYEMLGLKHTSAGAVVGWVKGHGDDYVDFGIFDGSNTGMRDFVNGWNKSILLDFNVDGVIYDLI
jgi:hypothetical protein